MTKRRSKKKSYLIATISTVTALLIIYIVFVIVKTSVSKSGSELDGPYDVIRVVDGDTFIAGINGADTYIRLIGIDAPESVADESYKENTEEGRLAGEYLTNLLEGNRVYLEYDEELTDNYGRTLCYVYLHDAEVMVNELLLRNGYAQTMTIEPNVKYRERFISAEIRAKHENKGFWGTGFYQ